MACEMAAADVTVGAFPEQVIGGYPAEDLVQWRGFVDGPVAASSALRAETAAARARCSCSASSSRSAATSTTPPRSCTAGGSWASCRRRSSRPTTSSTRRAPSPAAPPGTWTLVGRALRRPRVRLRLRHARGRGVRGRVVARRPDAPPLLRRRRARREHLRLALPHGRDGHAPGDARDALGRQPVHARLRQRPSAPTTGSSSTAAASSSRTAAPCSRRRAGARGGLRRRSTSTARRLRTENTTWRNDCLDARTDLGAPHGREGGRGDRRPLEARLPRADPRELLPPAPAAPRTAREEFCDDLLDALALGVGDYFEKTKAFKGFGIALSGGRDSLLTLLIAWRYVQRASRPPRRRGARRRASSSAPSTCRRATPRPHERLARGPSARSWACRSWSSPSRRRSTARPRSRARWWAASSPPHQQNVQARLRSLRMWNWANTSGMLFLQTGNMSEKAMGYTTIGGDLEGALAVLANVPKTVVIYLLEYLLETARLRGHPADALGPRGPRARPEPEGRGRAHALPRARRVLPPLRRREAARPRRSSRRSGDVPRGGARAPRAWVEKFVRLFVQSIYKWVQAPLSLHVGNLDLERERALQLPVVETRGSSSPRPKGARRGRPRGRSVRRRRGRGRHSPTQPRRATPGWPSRRARVEEEELCCSWCRTILAGR
jgi:NAD+ synthase (glutamine-hydrolysing)